MSKMIEIRCPYKRVSTKNGKKYGCDRVVEQVKPGSVGEARSSSCKRQFPFEGGVGTSRIVN